MAFQISSLKQRIYASLLFLGAGILLYRTITMLSQGAMEILVLWVSALLIAELLIDALCMITTVVWWITNDSTKDRLPLRFGATAAILHAIRVLIFLLGRVGPWYDFDVQPVKRAMHGERWSWNQVWFASILSLLGIIGVIIIWQFRKRKKGSSDPSGII